VQVLGLDLSLTATGYVLPNGTTGLLKPGSRRGMERLAWLREQILDLVLPATIVAVEGYSYGSHSSSFDLGELGGVIRLALHDAGIQYLDVAPAVLKGFATGKGNANKNEVLASAIKRLGYDGTSSDEADALWLRAAVLAACGEPVVEVPAAHLKHLAKLYVDHLVDR
jgi:crossover junction endodeoxyribonuclease RuvC